MCAGRPFFIRIGVSQASLAPASSSAASTPGHSRGSRSSTLRLQQQRRPSPRWSRSRRCRSSHVEHPDQQPQHVGVPLGVATPGSDADARHRHRRLRSPVVGERGQQRGARWACTARGRRDRRSSAPHGGARPPPAAEPAGGRARRPPCHRPPTLPRRRRGRGRGAPSRRRRRPRRRWRPARRPRGSARPRPGCPCTRPSASASRENTSWASERTSSCRPAPASSCSTSRQVRCGRGVGDLDVAAGGREAAAAHAPRPRAAPRPGRPCRRPRPARRAGRRRRPGRRAACRRWLPRRRRPRRPAPAQSATVAPMGVAGHPGGEDAGAVAVVDVDHAHPRCAGVQHRQQGGQPAEGGAVPDAGRHRHEGYADQAADHAGQGALHAGDHDEAVRPGEPFARLEQPVQPGHADVLDALDPGAVHGHGERGLGGDRRVGGAGADHGDEPTGRRDRAQRRRRGPPRRCAPRGARARTSVDRLGREPGGQHGAVGMTVVQRAQDADDLLGGLALAVDDLRVAGARGPVDVDARVAEVGGALIGALLGVVGHAPQTIRRPARSLRLVAGVRAELVRRGHALVHQVRDHPLRARA